MAIYLIDYENRAGKKANNGLEGIERLSYGDTVVVFLGKTSLVPQRALDTCVNKSKARVLFHKCRKIAKNYLDFQLVTYLGYLIASSGEKRFVIVSDDRGYFAAVDYWLLENPTVEVVRQPYIVTPPDATGTDVLADDIAADGASTAKQRHSKGDTAKKATGAAPGKAASSGNRRAAGAGKAAGKSASIKAGDPENGDAANRGAAGETSGISDAVSKQVNNVPADPTTEQSDGAATQRATRQRINKLDPPESIRKIARAIYKRQGIKLGYISQLYDEMRASPNANVFTTRLKNIYSKKQFLALKAELLEMFEVYNKMRY
ncbi:MAG: hypothetical protein LBU07_01055 [Coriobacteriales bacterium]|jgi:hypothetical protein|nr:hypothetical protein [Coriobacteriales bacterium]